MVVKKKAKSKKKTLNVFDRHQLAIARKTINMPDEVLNYLNATSKYGMTKAEARAIIKRMG